MRFDFDRLLKRHLNEEELEKYNHMQQKRAENSENLKKSLVGHVSALNDGVVAIIITIMLLEIPFPETPSRYPGFLWSVVVFLISFFIVADFWYENKRSFETAREVDHPVLILNFMFLASLALIPVMTKWILNRTDGFAVMNYGVIYLSTLILQNLLTFAIVRKRFQNHCGLFLKMTLSRIGVILILNVAMIVLGSRFPRQIIILYSLLPVLDFLQPRG
jgi:uncharacterized membrane protein